MPFGIELDEDIHLILYIYITWDLFIVFLLCSYYWRGQYRSKPRTAAHETSSRDPKRRGPDETRLKESEGEITGDRGILAKTASLEALLSRSQEPYTLECLVLFFQENSYKPTMNSPFGFNLGFKD
ncbi:hypothetical protein BJX70DRAFT_374685 [Aspergillus crustosus]